MNAKKRNWLTRPKGCLITISGRHIVEHGIDETMFEFFCSACGKIDDTGKFALWMFGKPNISGFPIDDREEKT